MRSWLSFFNLNFIHVMPVRGCRRAAWTVGVDGSAFHAHVRFSRPSAELHRARFRGLSYRAARAIDGRCARRCVSVHGLHREARDVSPHCSPARAHSTSYMGMGCAAPPTRVCTNRFQHQSSPPCAERRVAQRLRATCPQCTPGACGCAWRRESCEA